LHIVNQLRTHLNQALDETRGPLTRARGEALGTAGMCTGNLILVAQAQLKLVAEFLPFSSVRSGRP
jgi:hypothetical protein